MPLVSVITATGYSDICFWSHFFWTANLREH